jgi:hypothetical protein
LLLLSFRGAGPSPARPESITKNGAEVLGLWLWIPGYCAARGPRDDN